MTDADVYAAVARSKAKIKPGTVFRKAKVIDDLIAPREGVYCRCNPAPLGETPRCSGRYPWKGDDNEIREVFKMDSNRLNRFVSMINAAGGNFHIEEAIGERPMAHIDIPCDMLSHLHIEGDGSIGLLKKIVAPEIPDIRNIQTFNDRAVQITFADGTQTKSVCGKKETFDLYEGIAFCLFKRFLGENGHKGFNNLMRYAFKKLDEQEKAKEREAEIKAEKKQREEKKKLQAERRKDKKREEQIGVFVEALQRNLQELTNCMPVYSVPEPDVEFNKEPKEEQE